MIPLLELATSRFDCVLFVNIRMYVAKSRVSEAVVADIVAKTKAHVRPNSFRSLESKNVACHG